MKIDQNAFLKGGCYVFVLLVTHLHVIQPARDFGACLRFTFGRSLRAQLRVWGAETGATGVGGF